MSVLSFSSLTEYQYRKFLEIFAKTINYFCKKDLIIQISKGFKYASEDTLLIRKTLYHYTDQSNVL